MSNRLVKVVPEISLDTSQVNKFDASVAELQQEESTVKHVEELETIYFADRNGSHKKTKEERVLVTKSDLVILPLAALMYFVAYVVGSPSFCAAVTSSEYLRNAHGVNPRTVTALETPEYLEMECRTTWA